MFRLRCFSARVKGAVDPTSSLLQHMGIDHRCTHVLVPQEFLHGANVVALLQEVSRKAMAERISTLLIIRR